MNVPTQIEVKLHQIADCIYDKVYKKKITSLGLYNGEFGVLLFLCYYVRYSDSLKFVNYTRVYAEKLLRNFTSCLNIHTFSNGLSGVLYLVEFLRTKDFLDIDIDENNKILEHYLVQKVRQDFHNHYYDFMHGAIGVGLYFLKRENNIQILQEFVDYLYTSADKDYANNIFKWKSTVNYTTQEIDYNISLSHGMSSIVIFLARIIQSKIITTNKVYQMLEGAINFILSQEIDFQKYDSYFPSISKKEVSKSRLGWCYGDLGVAYALWYAGNIACEDKWKNKGLQILNDSTNRLSLLDNYVRDAGICHGTAGISMLYKRMYINTSMKSFLQASNYWLDQTVDFVYGKDKRVKNESDENANYWTNNISLLTGISGIGLVLISSILDDEQAWDEIFLM